MSVKIRLARFGRKKAPFYRLVVADTRAPRDGRFIEVLGLYHPLESETKVEINEERALHWLGEGATPSETVRSLFRKRGILKQHHELRLQQKSQPTAQTETQGD